jgi:7-cyano-7-deazaguanine synthase
MSTKIVVLLSGGQDSTTSLFWAKHFHGFGSEVELHTLAVKYGQRHAVELEAAKTISDLAGAVSHVEIDVSSIMTGGASDLLAANERDIASDGGMKDDAMPQGLPTSFVPGRNLMFLALAVARAGAVGAKHVVTGVCQTDYSGYPDCRSAFISQMEAAVREAWPSRETHPSIWTPLMELTKAQTVELALKLPGCWEALGHSVTCYYGKVPGCGECPSCSLRVKGFAEVDKIDPALTR